MSKLHNIRYGTTKFNYVYCSILSLRSISNKQYIVQKVSKSTLQNVIESVVICKENS